MICKQAQFLTLRAGKQPAQWRALGCPSPMLHNMAQTEFGCWNYTWFMDRNEFLKPFAKFIDERDRAQFHSIQNLAKSISIDSAELLTLFQLSSEAKNKVSLDEHADRLTYCFLPAKKVGGAQAQLFVKKVSAGVGKYPAPKANGKSTKYDLLKN